MVSGKRREAGGLARSEAKRADWSGGAAALATERAPGDPRDLPAAVPPAQVAADGFLLFRVAAKVGARQGELLQRRELALDPVEPGGIGRCEVEADLVGRRVLEHRGRQVRLVVVQHDVEDFVRPITPPHRLEKGEELPPVFRRANVP